MLYPDHQPQRISHLRRLSTILVCLTVGGFCLFKAGAGRLFNEQAHATTVASPETQFAQPKYKLKSVAEFKAGDEILAFNHETGKHEKSKVVQTFKRTSYHLRILTFKNKAGETQEIKTTNEHPFWSVIRQEYITAKELVKGETVRSPAGDQLSLVTSEFKDYPNGIAVYNVEVEGHHNYFVKAQGSRAPPLLAHNAECGDKLFRYVGEAEADLIRKTGKIPNKNAAGKLKDIYLSSRKYKTAGRAKTHLQLPNKPKYRIEIDPKNVKLRTKIKKILKGDNPQWGIGGGTEATTLNEILVDPVQLIKLIGAD